MATQRKPEKPEDFQKPDIEKPENLDFEKGLANVKRLVEKNKQWVREMASK